MARWVDPDHTCDLCAPGGVLLRPEDCTPVPGRCNAERWPNIEQGNDDGPNHFVGFCRKYPIRGATVCDTHGGAAPQVRAAAARKLEMDAAQAAVVTYGLPLDISPTEALLAEVQWTAGHVAWLRRQVQALQQDGLTWGKTREKSGGDDHGVTHEAGPPVLVELYDRERKHLVAVCATALKAGVEERRVRLAEQQGDLVADAIRAILDALDLTPEQAARVPHVVPAELRLLAGGAASA